MNLLNLAPDIQEVILFLPRVEGGRDPVTERDLRAIVARVNWEEQRGMWGQLPGSELRRIYCPDGPSQP